MIPWASLCIGAQHFSYLKSPEMSQSSRVIFPKLATAGGGSRSSSTILHAAVGLYTSDGVSVNSPRRLATVVLPDF